MGLFGFLDDANKALGKMQNNYYGQAIDQMNEGRIEYLYSYSEQLQLLRNLGDERVRELWHDYFGNGKWEPGATFYEPGSFREALDKVFAELCDDNNYAKSRQDYLRDEELSRQREQEYEDYLDEFYDKLDSNPIIHDIMKKLSDMKVDPKIGALNSLYVTPFRVMYGTVEDEMNGKCCFKDLISFKDYKYPKLTFDQVQVFAEYLIDNVTAYELAEDYLLPQGESFVEEINDTVRIPVIVPDNEINKW